MYYFHTKSLLRWLKNKNIFSFALVSLLPASLQAQTQNSSIALADSVRQTPTLAWQDQRIEIKDPFTSLGLFANDTFWDGQDRWRTGSYQRSWFWQDERFEFRMRNEYVAPSNLTDPNEAGDRPYASILNLGLFEHREYEGHHFYYGGSVDLINQIAFLENFHAWVHGVTGFSEFGVGDYLVPAATRASAEAGWFYASKQDFGYVIPFAEAQYGTREKLTAGLDIVWTDFEYNWMTRDQTTGHILGGLKYENMRRGYHFDWILGADVSYVPFDYFVDNAVSNVQNEPWRYRLRFGMRYHVGNSTVFVGPTYLSPEYVGQESGQILQSISFEFNL